MKHPLITFVNAAQAVLGSLLVTLSGYWIVLALLASFDQMLPLWSEGPRGLLLASAVPGIPGFATVVAAYGLLKEQFWAWILSLAIDVIVLGLLIYIMYGVTYLALTMLRISLAVLIVLLLLPPVRNFYWTAAHRKKEEAS